MKKSIQPIEARNTGNWHLLAEMSKKKQFLPDWILVELELHFKIPTIDWDLIQYYKPTLTIESNMTASNWKSNTLKSRLEWSRGNYTVALDIMNSITIPDDVLLDSSMDTLISLLMKHAIHGSTLEKIIIMT